MDWTTRVQIRAVIYSTFKVFLLPLWFPLWLVLWPIGYLYKSEKAEVIEEQLPLEEECDCHRDMHDGIMNLCTLHSSPVQVKDGLLVQGQHRLKQFQETDWTISILNAKGEIFATEPAYLDEDAKAKVEFHINCSTIAMESQLRCKGKLLVTSKLCPNSDGTYGVPVYIGDVLKVQHTWTPEQSMETPVTGKALKIEQIGAPLKNSQRFIVATNKIDPGDQKIFRLHKQGLSILHIAQQTCRSRAYVKKVLGVNKPKRTAVLTVLDSCGRARQHVGIRGDIFDQCIEARKFQATLKAKETFVVSAVTLENWEGEIVCREPYAFCLGIGDTFHISLDINDADIKNLGVKKELLWMGGAY